MRKTIGVCCILMGLLTLHLSAEESVLRFCLKQDSHASQSMAAFKDEVLTQIQKACQYVDEKDCAVVLHSDIDAFCQFEKTQCSFQQGVLEIVQGDGQGSFIEGSLREPLCMSAAKPKSWLLEQAEKLFLP